MQYSPESPDPTPEPPSSAYPLAPEHDLSEAVYEAVYEDLDGSSSFSSHLFEEVAVTAPALDDPEAAPAGATGDGFIYESEDLPHGDSAPSLHLPTASIAPVRPRVERYLPAPASGGGAPPPAPPPSPRVEARREWNSKANSLYRYRYLALGIFTLCVLGALLYSLLTPAKYESSAVLLIDTERPSGAQDALVGDFVDVPGMEARKVLNQALVLQEAPAIAERTAARLLASETPLTFADELSGASVTDAVARYLRREVVEVEPAGEEVDAIRVTATSTDPEEAARIATLYTEEYVALTREKSRERITATRQFLENQVARRNGELDETERLIAGYMTRTGAVGLDAQTQGAISQVAALQADLDRARIDVRMREATLASLEGEMAGLQPRMSTRSASTSDVQLQQLDTQIVELERVMEQIYLRNPSFRNNPNAHPDLRELEGRLTDLRSQKRRLAREFAGEVAASGGVNLGATGDNGESYVAALRRQIAEQRAALSGARASASAISGRLSAAGGVLLTIPEQSRELAQLQRRRSSTEELVIYLTQRLQEARVAEETEFGIAQMVRTPEVPRRPSGPGLPFILLLGAFLGGLLGLAAAVARRSTDALVYTPDDLESNGFTVVGTIPALGPVMKGATVLVEGYEVPPSLVTLARPFSPPAESFRHLHAALQGDIAPQVLLVTGPEVGCGKSFVAANLAVAAAQSGRRTLLVDADLRRPSVHGFLGLGASPALGADLDAEDFVYWNTAVPGLFALTAAAAAQTPADLWGPEQASRVLNGLRSAFDLVIVDAPPALVAADAAILAPHADAALLVASASYTNADALTQVAHELAGAGLHTLGAVLNRFDPDEGIGFRRTFGYRYNTRYAAEPSVEASTAKPSPDAPSGDGSAAAPATALAVIPETPASAEAPSEQSPGSDAGEMTFGAVSCDATSTAPLPDFPDISDLATGAALGNDDFGDEERTVDLGTDLAAEDFVIDITPRSEDQSDDDSGDDDFGVNLRDFLDNLPPA